MIQFGWQRIGDLLVRIEHDEDCETWERRRQAEQTTSCGFMRLTYTAVGRDALSNGHVATVSFCILRGDDHGSHQG